MSNYIKSFDWLTLVIYFILVFAGWLTIHAASYNLEGQDISIFDFSRPSGKQIVWIALSFILVIAILVTDTKFFMTYAPVIYTLMMILLLATIFIGTNINGSHSWIKIGSFSIQPAEFGKFSTALMLAWLFNTYNFKFTKPANFLRAVLIIIVPVILIILQRETGSALVYFSLVLLFYRQGMSGIILWLGTSMALIFVLGIRYSIDIATGEPSLFGQQLVLSIIPFLVVLMFVFYLHDYYSAFKLGLFSAIVLILGGLLVKYLPPYLPEPYAGLFIQYVTYRNIALFLSVYSALYSLWAYLLMRYLPCLWVSLIGLFFVGWLFVCHAAFNKLEDHQRTRIEVLLGIKEDLKGAGYNVNQAKIAIGSGGFWGKGYLEGTQTKLSYVPEQETDFIFCTIGEEQGFLGSTLVILLYMALILRLIYLAERQRTVFAQIYGYCVASIFAFHVFINVGMVIGLVPVIGIPLPFFSYGGSGLWSFTILLFIFLKLDMSRIDNY